MDYIKIKALAALLAAITMAVGGATSIEVDNNTGITECWEVNPVGDKIAVGISCGVVKTSAYWQDFYSVKDRYIITSEKELDIFYGYMRDGAMQSQIDERLKDCPIDEYTLFIVPIQSSSGGYRYRVTGAELTDNGFELSYTAEGSEIMTQDMAMYYPYAIVPKTMTEGKYIGNWRLPSEHIFDGEQAHIQ